MTKTTKRRATVPIPILMAVALIAFIVATTDFSNPIDWIPIAFALAGGYVALLLTLPWSYRRMMAAGDPSDPCPRCEVRPRGSGWCEPCSAELVTAALTPPPAVARFDRATAASDFAAMARELAERVTVTTQSGREGSFGPRAWRRSMRLVGLASRRMTSEVFAEYADPLDPRVGWTLTRSTIAWRLAATHEATAVSRYVVDEAGRIAEMTAFSPVEGPRPAATITVD